MLVLGLFLILELIVANAIEPVLYGRSMGVSEVALLVSAAFWAWLWGAVGLALAVPLTICLAVLGKYVPQLEVFGILLRDRPALPLPTRYYQRLLAHDEDAAADMVEEYLNCHPWEAVFDEVLMPALALARRDQERGELEADEQETVYRTTREVLDDLVFRREQDSRRAAVADGEGSPQQRVVPALGFSAYDEADELTLRMLALLLEPSGCRLEVLSAKALTAEMLQRTCEEQPLFVVVSALPPRGMSRARNLCKRLLRGMCGQQAVHPPLGSAGESGPMARVGRRWRGNNASGSCRPTDSAGASGAREQDGAGCPGTGSGGSRHLTHRPFHPLREGVPDMAGRAILGWLILGLICGILARLLVPGRDPMGRIATIVLGIAGSLIGGVIAYSLHLGTEPYEPGGWVLSIIGAVLVLLTWYWVVGRRTAA